MADVLGKLSALVDRLKSGSTTPETDMMLNTIPKDLLEEILSDSGGTLAEFQDVAVDFLKYLLPSCSKDTLEDYGSLTPLLLQRLRTSEEMDSLDDIAACILSLSMVNTHDQAEYLHDTVDVLSSYCINNSRYFPFTRILQRLTDCIIVLRPSCSNCDLVCSNHTWPADTRTLIDRALKTKTELITDDTRVLVFHLVKEVVETLGVKWFAPNVPLLLLLVHLIVVQVRISLDKPDNVDPQILSVCYHILEMGIQCVEESTLLDDAAATRIATAVREAAFYSVDYWVKTVEQEEHLNEHVELVLYRFVSCLLAIGGAEILPVPLMRECSPLMLQVFQREIVNGNYSTAHLLLPNLDVLPKLTMNVITLLVEVVIAQYPNGEWKSALNEVVLTLESLNGRVDYYNAETLAEARTKLMKAMPDCELSSMLAKL
ncbi:unnamed protein product [Haemonchus placei]|uniref:Neurochondrin n=1 Tax=Haemonchus placei TaxID=6290 RepID=A0A0N4VST3_HAEPC|nr:unnamed protein product [Haemonchus placei]